MTHMVTVDGPAGSGKSTVSRVLAGRIGYSYLDTGAMYRAVALAVSRSGLDLNDSRGLEDLCRTVDLQFVKDADPPRLIMGGEDVTDLIRTPEMDMLSSTVSGVSEVRRAMTTLQRRIAGGGGYVAEGRDMGTVVFPEAEYKFFLTASVRIRAQRRYEEILSRGETAVREVVEADLRQRDSQDRLRALAPLKPADDAVIIDSSALTVEQVVQSMVDHMKNRR